MRLSGLQAVKRPMGCRHRSGGPMAGDAPAGEVFLSRARCSGTTGKYRGTLSQRILLLGGFLLAAHGPVAFGCCCLNHRLGTLACAPCVLGGCTVEHRRPSLVAAAVFAHASSFERRRGSYGQSGASTTLFERLMCRTRDYLQLPFLFSSIHSSFIFHLYCFLSIITAFLMFR